ncbi:MAG: hypothetical protein ACT4PZ_16350 [Panacagrimonas sp.]
MRNLIPTPSVVLLRKLAFGAGLALFAAASAQAADVRLVGEVLALDQQIDALERQTLAPGTSEFTVFVGSQPNELRLRKLSLRIDDFPAVQYEYAQPEWEAIAAGALHPAWSGALPEGEHRLRMELFAREVDAGPTDARAVERLDRVVRVVPGAALEIDMTQQRFGKTGLALIEWSDGTPSPPGVQHPWVRAGAFLLSSGRPYAAARMFRRLQVRNPGAYWIGDANATMAAALEQISGRSRSDAGMVAGIERLNAIVGTVVAGDVRGIETLTLMGTEEALDESAWILRDRANLMLGYHHLRQGAGELALEALGKVRSTGPHGNEALLGFGWAFLVPPSNQPVATAPAMTVASATGEFARPNFIGAIEAPTTLPYKEHKTLLERALVPWTELIGRDPLDPAAQEGSLALAWALDQLDTGKQAHTYYTRSAEQLELARRRLDQALQHVGSGALAVAITSGQNDTGNGWRIWLADLPYADETEYLKYLLTDLRFVESIDQYRQARVLRDGLDAFAPRLQALPDRAAEVAVLTPRIDSAHSEALAAERFAQQAMEDIATELLNVHKRRTERFLGEARFALARHFDSATEPEVELKRGGGAS